VIPALVRVIRYKIFVNGTDWETRPETAYHDEGHIVPAAAVGLDLRPAGILVSEVRNVAAGIACYWEKGGVEPVLRALRAGQTAQQKEFPKSAIAAGVNQAKPTDSITFKENALVLGTVPLSNGQASFPEVFSKPEYYKCRITRRSSLITSWS
jgi:hypothetical protein